MAGGRWRVGRHWKNEWNGGAERRDVRLTGCGFYLVLSGAPLWQSRVAASLPDFIGAGLVRPPHTGCVHTLRNERDHGGEVFSRAEHNRAAARSDFGNQRLSILFVRFSRFVALRRKFYRSGYRVQP